MLLKTKRGYLFYIISTRFMILHTFSVFRLSFSICFLLNTLINRKFQKSHTASNITKLRSKRWSSYNRLNRGWRQRRRQQNETRRERSAHNGRSSGGFRTENKRTILRSAFWFRRIRRSSVSGSQSGSHSHRNNPQANRIALLETFCNSGFKSNSESYEYIREHCADQELYKTTEYPLI